MSSKGNTDFGSGYDTDEIPVFDGGSSESPGGDGDMESISVGPYVENWDLSILNQLSAASEPKEGGKQGNVLLQNFALAIALLTSGALLHQAGRNRGLQEGRDDGSRRIINEISGKDGVSKNLIREFIERASGSPGFSGNIRRVAERLQHIADAIDQGRHNGTPSPDMTTDGKPKNAGGVVTPTPSF